jgi:hypothetical protein
MSGMQNFHAGTNGFVSNDASRPGSLFARLLKESVSFPTMNILYPRIRLSLLPAMFGYAVLGAILAGVYGILHDQITYSISQEYFTFASENGRTIPRAKVTGRFWSRRSQVR